MATVIGDAFIRIRPLTTGFAAETAASVDAEVGGAGVLSGSLASDAKKKGAQLADSTVVGAENSGAGKGFFARIFGEGAVTDGEVAGASFVGAAGSKITGGLSKISKIISLGMSDNPYIAVGAAVVVAAGAVAGMAIKMATDMQKANVQIANNADISIRAADKIGKAFEGTAFKSEDNANTMATAYAAVAGQMGLTAGHALNAKQALEYMTFAQRLAEASGDDLGTSTNSLSGFMATFKIRLKDVGGASNTLFNTSSLVKVGQEALVQQFQRMRSRMGDLIGGYKDYAAIQVDAAKQGFAGRTALLEQSSAAQTLLKPQLAIVAARVAENNALYGLTPRMRELAKEYAKGAFSSGVLAIQTQGMTLLQRHQIAAYKSASDQLITARLSQHALGVETLNSHHAFVGWSSVIDQLHDKFEKMNHIQQLNYATTLFGSGAAHQMTAIILAGGKAYERYYAMANKSNTVNQAATRQQHTLGAEWAIFRSGIHDAMIELGQKLMPAFDKVKIAAAKLIALIIRDWPNVQKAFEEWWTVVGPIFKQAWDTIKTLYDILMDLIGFITDIFTGRWTAAWGEVKNIFSSLLGFVRNFVTNFGNYLLGLSTVAGKVGAFFGRLILRGLRALPGALVHLLTLAFDKLKDVKWGNVWHGMLIAFEYIMGKIIEVYDDTVGRIPGMHIHNPWANLFNSQPNIGGKSGLVGSFAIALAKFDKAHGYTTPAQIQAAAYYLRDKMGHTSGSVTQTNHVTINVKGGEHSGKDIAKHVTEAIRKHDDELLRQVKAYGGGR
jgi:hypothetical protein